MKTLLITLFTRHDWLQVLQAAIAPVLVPLAPAAYLGNKIFAGLLTEGIQWHVALVFAIASTVGVESVGGLASFVMILKFDRKQWVPAVLAAVAVALYIAVLAYAMHYFNNTAFLVYVLLTPTAFVIAALFQVDRSARQETTQDTSQQIALLNAQKNLTNARTRQHKATGIDMSVLSAPFSHQMHQNAHENAPESHQNAPLTKQQKQEKCFALWDSGTRNKTEIARQLDMGPGGRNTVTRWLVSSGRESKK